MNNQTLPIKNPDEIIDQVISELMKADEKKEVKTDQATNEEVEKVMEYLNV